MDILLPHDKAPMNSFKSTLLIGAAITGLALQAQHSLPDPFMLISFKIRNPVRCIRRRGEEMDLSFSDAKGSGDKILSDLHILNLTVPDRDIIFPEITVTDFQESPVAPAAVRQIFEQHPDQKDKDQPAAPSQIRTADSSRNTAHTAADAQTTAV